MPSRRSHRFCGEHIRSAAVPPPTRRVTPRSADLRRFTADPAMASATQIDGPAPTTCTTGRSSRRSRAHLSHWSHRFSITPTAFIPTDPSCSHIQPTVCACACQEEAMGRKRAAVDILTGCLVWFWLWLFEVREFSISCKDKVALRQSGYHVIYS
jgi:hypothetical protein